VPTRPYPKHTPVVALLLILQLPVQHSLVSLQSSKIFRQGVGPALGITLGDVLGTALGLALGLALGKELGPALGDALGPLIGAELNGHA
jgi:hypothetical protein